MKLKNNTSILSISLTALMLTMGNGQAVAEDGKVYPASFCTPVSTGHATGAFSINRGEWVNESNFTTVVECPIIKDSINKSLRNGFVRVIDRNASFNRDVKCTIASRRTQIFPNQGFTTTVKSRSSFGVQTLNFGALGHNGKNTTYTMQCSVPGKINGVSSRIMGYYISENT